MDKAQEIKHNVGAVTWVDNPDELDLKKEDRTIAERVGVAANGFAKELSRTLYAYKIWDKKPLSMVYLSGGTSKLVGIEDYLGDQLGVQVVKNNLLNTDLKIDEKLSEYSEILPQGVAISLRAVSGAKRHSTINLRKGEFAYSQDYEAILKGASVFFKWVSAGLTVLLAAYFIQYFFYESQTTKLQNQFKTAYLKIDPSKKSKVNKMKNFSGLRKFAINNLQKTVNDNRFAIDEFTASMSGSGALLALRDISRNVSSEVKLDVTSYDYTESQDLTGKLVLKGETDGYGSVGKIKEALSGLVEMENVVEKSGSKPGSDGKIIEFTINADYVPATIGNN